MLLFALTLFLPFILFTSSKAKEEELVRSKRTAMVSNPGKFNLPITYYVNFTKEDLEISQKSNKKSEKVSNKLTKAKQNLQSAIYIIQNQTCIRFNESKTPLKSDQEGLIFNMEMVNKLLFGKSEQQPQCVNMSRYHYSVDDFLKNIGSALGMQLEMYRHDRDDHIIINDVNVTERYPITNLTDDIKFLENISYDIGSMYQHCSGRYPNISGINYIPKDFNYWDTFCLRKFSFSDYKALNELYCNKNCTKKLDCKNSGYTNPNNHTVCKCPPFYRGKLCDELKNPNLDCNIPKIVNVTNSTFIRLEDYGNKTCYFRLQTSEDYKIEVFVASLFAGADQRPILGHCDKKNALEARYYKDKGATGALFCGPLSSHYIVSRDNVTDFKYTGNHTDDAISLLVRRVNSTFEQADVIDPKIIIDTSEDYDEHLLDEFTPKIVNDTK